MLNANIVPLPGIPAWRRGTAQILFHVLCDAWSSGKSSIKYINNHGVLERDLETDKLISGSGMSAAREQLEDLGWEGAPPALGEGDLVGLPVQDTAASCYCSLFTTGFAQEL